MTAGTPVVFAPAKKKFLTKGLDVTSAGLKAALFTSLLSLTPGFIGASGDARFADLSNETSGTGYSAGGVSLTSISVNYYVVFATVFNGGTGGTNGSQTVTGTTGTGAKFTASVTVSGGTITSVDLISLAGAYTTLPTNPGAEPVSGAGLTGATLTLNLGVMLTFANPSWSSATFNAKWIVFYDNTAPNKDLLAYADLDTTNPSGVSITSDILTYQLDTAGLIALF